MRTLYRLGYATRFKLQPTSTGALEPFSTKLWSGKMWHTQEFAAERAGVGDDGAAHVLAHPQAVQVRNARGGRHHLRQDAC